MPSPLTVEDLGPGDWIGPFADREGLDGTGRNHTCSLMGEIYFNSGQALLDEQLAYFGDGETRVEVRAERYAPDDPDLAGRLASVDRLDRCVVDDATPRLGVASSTWVRNPDGVVVFEERSDRRTSGALDFEFRIAMTTTQEWFLLVEVSHLEGAEGPDAVELLERAVANVEALPAPDEED